MTTIDDALRRVSSNNSREELIELIVSSNREGMEYLKERDAAELQVALLRDVLERVQLEVHTVICACGEEWKDTDLANLGVKQALAQTQDSDVARAMLAVVEAANEVYLDGCSQEYPTFHKSLEALERLTSEEK